jgi:hypothetical protein
LIKSRSRLNAGVDVDQSAPQKLVLFGLEPIEVLSLELAVALDCQDFQKQGITCAGMISRSEEER